MAPVVLTTVVAMSEQAIRNFINGEYVEATTDSSFELLDPATEKT
jgi:betaine-aldehyde dehydrogenase